MSLQYSLTLVESHACCDTGQIDSKRINREIQLERAREREGLMCAYISLRVTQLYRVTKLHATSIISISLLKRDRENRRRTTEDREREKKEERYYRGQEERKQERQSSRPRTVQVPLYRFFHQSKTVEYLLRLGSHYMVLSQYMLQGPVLKILGKTNLR